MRITRSNPILAVHDLDRSGAWYRDVLGCELGDHRSVAYLHVDDVDELHRNALAAGAEVLKAPRDEPWGMRELGLRSPDGHRFMLGQPTEPS